MDYWRNLNAFLRPQRPSMMAFFVFIGTDGSMGLRTGQTVLLSVYRECGRLWAYWDGGRCPYDTTATFWRNWMVLQCI